MIGTSFPQRPRAAAYRVAVRELPIEAMIGVNADEQGRRQRLLVSVDAVLDAARPSAQLADTIDYCAIVKAARLVARRHVGLIEQYAQLVGEQCLALGPVESVTVSVTKPDALEAGLAATVVRVERPVHANVFPFSAHLASGHLIRFAFQRGINVDAQHALAGFIRNLGDSIRGVALDDLTFDPRTGEWTGRLKLSGTGPRAEDDEMPKRLEREDAR